MRYYLYEVKHTQSGKIYVGVHKSESLDDGYMGSGTVIKHAIKKHGLENFTKRVIEEFSSSKEMYEREKEIVTDEFLARVDVYNLRRGGLGGFDFLNDGGELHLARVKRAGLARAKVMEKQGNPFSGKQIGNNFALMTQDARKQIARSGNTPELKAQKSAKMKVIGSGTGNSQFGSIWITYGVINRKTRDKSIPEGW